LFNRFLRSCFTPTEVFHSVVRTVLAGFAHGRLRNDHWGERGERRWQWWPEQITRYKIYGYARRVGREGRHQREGLEALAERNGVDPLRRMTAQELQERLKKHLRPELYQQLLDHLVDGRKLVELAGASGLSADTLGKRLTHAVEQFLRTHYPEEGNHAG
jgi:DNA-directed RNA polymerase specialized sigma24 family protein